MHSKITELNWQPFPKKDKFDFYSQVMFKRLVGYTFQSECDWCIGIRYPHSKDQLLFGDPNIYPKTIFVNLEDGNIDLFIKNILPYIPNKHRFILIIGDSDHTFPNQIDFRYDCNFLDCYEILVNDIRIHHIFCVHLDIPKNNRISPLPVGFSLAKSELDILRKRDFNIDFDSKIPKILNCSRLRAGKQWKDRSSVYKLCSNEWVEFSYSLEGKLSFNDFSKTLSRYSFILCPHGGGLEPNPKVFHALNCGVIPIVKKFVNCEFLYKGLPVVFIPDWKSENIKLENLSYWKEEYRNYFVDKNMREEVLRHLTTNYWKDYIQKESKAKFKIWN